MTTMFVHTDSFLVAPGAPAGVAHGFSTRTGGVSKGVYATNNMHDKKGDSREHVDENRRRFLTALGLDPARLFTVTQEHTVALVDVDGLTPEETTGLEADGLLSGLPGVAVGVTTADCLPVLLAAPDGGAVAALHAGWRGLVAGILGRGVEALCEKAGCAPTELWAAVGPGIRPCCFEVGGEVVEAFSAAGFPERFFTQGNAGRPYGDLAGLAVWALGRAGLQDVHVVGTCTRCEPERYFSYRRDGWPTGLQLSVIGMGGTPRELWS
jgi:YfiH family protein